MDIAALLPILLIFAVFYLLLIRPQQKRAKQARVMQAELRAGDTVMLTSGIHGRLTAADDAETVTVEVSPGVELKVARAAVATVVPLEAPAEESLETDAADESGDATDRKEP